MTDRDDAPRDSKRLLPRDLPDASQLLDAPISPIESGWIRHDDGRAPI